MKPWDFCAINSGCNGIVCSTVSLGVPYLIEIGDMACLEHVTSSILVFIVRVIYLGTHGRTTVEILNRASPLMLTSSTPEMN